MGKWKKLTNAQRETAIIRQRIRLKGIDDMAEYEIGQAVLELMENAQAEAAKKPAPPADPRQAEFF